MFILPRLRLGTGLAVSGLMLAALFNAHLVLMTLKSMWVPLMVPAIALITGHLLLAGKRMLHDRVAAYKVELAESNRMLGLSFQSQGHLDMAFDKFRRCPVDHSMMELSIRPIAFLSNASAFYLWPSISCLFCRVSDSEPVSP